MKFVVTPEWDSATPSGTPPPVEVETVFGGTQIAFVLKNPERRVTLNKADWLAIARALPIPGDDYHR